MVTVQTLTRKPRALAQRRKLRKQARGYWLSSDELLEYPGLNGFRSLCHLFIYLGGDKPTVCLVGNFETPCGTSTSNAIEVVATKIEERIDTDRFRLISWYPHGGFSPPFSEAQLEHVPPTTIPLGHILLGDGEQWHASEHTATVRFINPNFAPITERQLVRLLGQAAVDELNRMGGIKGDYRPDRLFGKTGERLAQEIQAHNHRQGDAIAARISQWQAGE